MSDDFEKGDYVDQGRIEEVAPDQAIVRRWGALGRVFRKLFDHGVEARGIERVPEDERETKNIWNNLLMWWSVNTVLTTIPIGVLGQEYFYLDFGNTVGTILGFAALGAIATSFVATLGPKTGLRTMIISRYSTGYVGGIIYSILNIITQLGFSVTAVILGGESLANLNPGTLPLTVGVLIIGICSLIPCFIGYNMVHIYERYAWMVITIVMFMLWGLGAKAGFDIHAQTPLQDTGKAFSADILSFGGIIFGSVSGWAPVAADYNCRLPADTSSTKVFLLTFFGLWIPVCFVEILGAALMTITKTEYVDAFTNGATGGLLSQVLSPWNGFGKFILFILAFSVIANNVPNTYSAGLSVQALGRPFALVPRFIWTFVIFVIYTVAGIAGREHFAEILSNFLSILSYWTAFFIVITAEEHFIFRRKGGKLGGYNLEDYDSPKKLPMGIAGLLAAGFGVAGAIVGMAETWYIGPIGKLAGTAYGGDLGFELAAAFAAVTYPPLRYLEIRYVGR